MVEAFIALDDDERSSFRKKLRRYTRLYGFLSQVVTFRDAALEKLYAFASLLLRRLPPDASELPTEVLEAVDMESYRLARTAEGKIEIPGGPGELEPDGGGERPASDDPLKPLSEIVAELNQRFGYEGNGATLVSIDHVFRRIEDDKVVDAAVRSNTPDNAKLTFDTRTRDYLEDLIDENARLYNKMTKDQAFGDDLRRMLYERYLASTDFVRELVEQGEGKNLELKATLRYDLEEGAHNPTVVTHSVLKTIAAFTNTDGGRLLIGVADDGSVVGIETDGFDSNDNFMLHLMEVTGSALGERTGTCVDPKTKAIDGKTVCIVSCRRSPEPVLLKWRKTNKHPEGDLYVRTGPRSVALSREEARRYVVTRFGEEALAASPLAAVPAEAAPAAAPKKRKPARKTTTDPVLLFRRVEPAAEERFKTCLPLVDLAAAAGAFSEAQTLAHGVLDEAPEWVEILKKPKKMPQLGSGMFVARVRGRSMEPRIPDGAYCVFRSPVTGTRQGRVVLVTARDFADPEHGGRYTVKIYNSVKEEAEDGSWRHEKIVLRPVNKAEFEPIELAADDDVAVVAEVVATLG